MGLVVHVVNHTAQARSTRLTAEDRDDLCSEVFLTLIRDDFAVLRHFRGQSSLATYLTVIARRTVVRSLMRQRSTVSLAGGKPTQGADAVADSSPRPEQRISDREEVQRLLDALEGREAEVVRMYHLEAKSYHEISSAVGVPENSVGPILSRARNKMRRAGVNPATS
jgi:RNA polymerase sigma-70 factor (ECF subfamily)